MRSWLWLLAVGAVGLAVAGGVARGDGGYFKSRDRSTWRPVEGHEQRAVIACEGGRQKMWVALSVPSADEKSDTAAEERGVWVLPVKGKPDEVRVDLVREFPRLAGRSVRKRLESQVEMAVVAMGATQVWPAIFVCVLMPSLSREYAGVHVEVSKFGLTTQVVSVETAELLTQHIASETGTAPDLSSFAPYFGGNYTFIVTMVRDSEEARKAAGRSQQLAVVAEFPSEAPWYPMLGTRVYGEEKVPVVVQVMGEWRLEGGRYAGYERVFEKDDEQLGGSAYYTRVWLTGMSARMFDEEMVFIAGANRTDAVAMFLTRGWGLAVFWSGVVAVHLGLSALAGAVVASLMRQRVRDGARMGLYNVGTVFLVHWASKRRARADRSWRAEAFSRAFMLTYSGVLLFGLAWVVN